MSPCYFVVLAPSWLLLPLTCRGTFLFPAFFAQGPLFRPTPSGVLWPKQTFLSQQHKKYHYSTGNGKRATTEEENLNWGREKRSFLPQHFVKYINSTDGTSWNFLILNPKKCGVQICQKWFRFLFESYTNVPICSLKVIKWEMWLKKILSNVLEAQSYYYSSLMVVVKQVFT